LLLSREVYAGSSPTRVLPRRSAINQFTVEFDVHELQVLSIPPSTLYVVDDGLPWKGWGAAQFRPLPPAGLVSPRLRMLLSRIGLLSRTNWKAKTSFLQLGNVPTSGS